MLSPAKTEIILDTSHNNDYKVLGLFIKTAGKSIFKNILSSALGLLQALYSGISSGKLGEPFVVSSINPKSDEC